ncbi:ADP-ribosylation factor-like protein 6-interacting protein 4 isoform X1 [Sinocyclocheilus anshuiensis]|uniref:ADP-ribosylation factor-like protein 6-interacting protein 4 isoform X1 n=1 Tax=Sinocyclocheilus anshuiensis TaxID=1608454 RepID=UPI0007B86D16|nr:PREDICTED: ADP-ribosylation factor-like protein 6-interacting protein 4 isoform X1 [Sinocyclocheilus anshuiensis]XP_016325934.1 PREDICTED: ADP-ribosylation factor-like protein 6-interacting protein 4 isoform X1 [Sinocyclocheilus anshuiensis]XP_016325935.1 PREDICTED: ADP-ribosylation factor-like protein 6-interacting protein 4 isoform X1 [Sinocyclocheilus anshuiensis]
MLAADLRADTEMRANPEACHHQVPGDPVQALKRDLNVPLTEKKMKRRSPSSSSSSSSSTSPSREKKTKKKKKRQEVKKLKREEKKEKKRQKKLALKAERAAASVSNAVSDETPQTYLKTWQSEEAKVHGPVMTDEQKASFCTKRPMTKEDYEARQSVIRRVLDPETGRTRLVRGDGEILEEIVSKERPKEINKKSTKGDGDAFQKKLGINR